MVAFGGVLTANWVGGEEGIPAGDLETALAVKGGATHRPTCWCLSGLPYLRFEQTSRHAVSQDSGAIWRWFFPNSGSAPRRGVPDAHSTGERGA